MDDAAVTQANSYGFTSRHKPKTQRVIISSCLKYDQQAREESTRAQKMMRCAIRKLGHGGGAVESE
ncbi:MAG TPA: hypothetical protein VF481_15650 [Novosphingobium sp.]